MQKQLNVSGKMCAQNALSTKNISVSKLNCYKSA